MISIPGSVRLLALTAILFFCACEREFVCDCKYEGNADTSHVQRLVIRSSRASAEQICTTLEYRDSNYVRVCELE